MEDGDQFNSVISNTIRNYVRSLRYNQLSCARETTGAAQIGERRQVLDCVKNSRSYMCGSVGIVFRNVVA